MTEPLQHARSPRPWPARGLCLTGLILSTAAAMLTREVAPIEAWQLPASGAASVLFLGLGAWGVARLRPSRSLPQAVSGEAGSGAVEDAP